MDETERKLLDSIDPDRNHFIDNEVNFSKFSMVDFYKSNINNDNSLNIMHYNSHSLLKDGCLDEYVIRLYKESFPYFSIHRNLAKT